ncbi:MAG: PH domain-containing protein [Planctomycetota bacterium]
MGLLNKVLGNAAQVDPAVVKNTVGPLLLPDETIDLAYKIIRDTFVFTDRRLILVNVQGVTGKKVNYRSIPYTSIVDFAVETAGTFDTDA